MESKPRGPRCACSYPAEPGSIHCGNPACELHARGEGRLELVRESGGWRHYLRDEPVHCGEGLLLAGVDWVEGIGDALQRKLSAPRRWTRVRYESPLASDTEPPALLYTQIDGHTAIITAHHGSELVFRWPGKRR